MPKIKATATPIGCILAPYHFIISEDISIFYTSNAVLEALRTTQWPEGRTRSTSYVLLLKSATVASAFAFLAAAATSLVTIVFPIGASAMPASFRC